MLCECKDVRLLKSMVAHSGVPFRVRGRCRSHFHTVIPIATRLICCPRDMLDRAFTSMPGKSINAITIPITAPRCFIALTGFTIPSMRPKAARMDCDGCEQFLDARPTVHEVRPVHNVSPLLINARHVVHQDIHLRCRPSLPCRRINRSHVYSE